jgi:DNA end-binding protein Ku
MARAIWSGAISFGLVNVPVKLYSATSPKSVRFNQISAKTGGRIKQKRVDESTGDEVPFEDIVKGYEITPDRYVLVAPEELDAINPKATKTIDIEEFVDLAEIDPIFYDHSYYLAPTTGGTKAYKLLLDAMGEAEKVGIGKFILRSKEQLCALRVGGDGSKVLTLTTMLFGDEVLSPDRIDELDQIADATATERELKMAQQLIASLSAEFDPTKYKDEYREQVLELIEKKAAGEEIVIQPEAEETEAAPDLMAALEASLAAIKSDSSDDVPSEKPARKRAAAPKAKPKASAKSK